MFLLVSGSGWEYLSIGIPEHVLALAEHLQLTSPTELRGAFARLVAQSVQCGC
jgi:hypothetical protein